MDPGSQIRPIVQSPPLLLNSLACMPPDPQPLAPHATAVVPVLISCANVAVFSSLVAPLLVPLCYTGDCRRRAAEFRALPNSALYASGARDCPCQLLIELAIRQRANLRSDLLIFPGFSSHLSVDFFSRLPRRFPYLRLHDIERVVRGWTMRRPLFRFFPVVGPSMASTWPEGGGDIMLGGNFFLYIALEIAHCFFESSSSSCRKGRARAGALLGRVMRSK